MWIERLKESLHTRKLIRVHYHTTESQKRIPINLVLVVVFIAVVVMTMPRVDSSCFINTSNAPKMTYNYVLSLAFMSIALPKVVIGKEIIGIDTIQINH